MALAYLIVGALAVDDPCNANADCNTCIKQHYCGWCSAPVVYRDGSAGAQCAGFSINGSANPFVCYGVFSTVACVPGYICGPNKYCVETDPGSGTTRDVCERNCSNTGMTYNCDKKTGKCVVAPAGAGTSLDDCTKKCTPPPVPIAPATPTSPSQAPNAPGAPPAPFEVVPGTPFPLIGLWRGVSISNGYKPGEFDFLFDNTSLTILDPSGQRLKGMTIQPLGGRPSNQFWVQLPSIGTLRFMWEAAPNGAQTINIDLAHGQPDGPAPTDIVSSLSAGGGVTAWALSMCIPGTPCVFKSPLGTTTTRKLKQADHCAPQGSCLECLAVPFCGWCSGPVKYASGRRGAHCAGLSNSTDPFTCDGTYATIHCPALYTCNAAARQCVLSDTGAFADLESCQKACFPAQTYECNMTSGQCEPTKVGRGSSLPVCQETCNKTRPPPVPSPIAPSTPTSPAMAPSLPPITPITPPVLIGLWRGVEVDNRYQAGEWDWNFDMNGGVEVYMGGAHAFSAKIGLTSGGWLVLNITSGSGAGEVRLANYQVANTMSVAFVTMALGAPGVASGPPDYSEAMTNVKAMEFVLVRCVAANCEFTPTTQRRVVIDGQF